MRLTVLSGALLVGLLATAGSSLAIIEAVGAVAQFANQAGDEALRYPAVAQEQAQQAAGDPAGFAEDSAATAQAVVSSFAATVEAVAALELGALSGATDVVESCTAYPETCSQPAFWEAFVAYFFEA